MISSLDGSEESESDDEMRSNNFSQKDGPLSDKLKLDSMSVFYSKTMYPISLGHPSDLE